MAEYYFATGLQRVSTELKKVLEVRAFGQKEKTAILIRMVSKLRFFFGGEGGIRTHVTFYRQLDFKFYGLMAV